MTLSGQIQSVLEEWYFVRKDMMATRDLGT